MMNGMGQAHISCTRNESAALRSAQITRTICAFTFDFFTLVVVVVVLGRCFAPHHTEWNHNRHLLISITWKRNMRMKTHVQYEKKTNKKKNLNCVGRSTDRIIFDITEKFGVNGNRFGSPAGKSQTLRTRRIVILIQFHGFTQLQSTEFPIPPIHLCSHCW